MNRCGELLRELTPERDEKTGPVLGFRGGGSPNSPRKQAAPDVGLPLDQAKMALRVANVPAETFT